MLTESQQSDRAVALGIVVRIRRKALGLSQERLAEMAGCDRQGINRLENARFSPLVSNLERIADALGWTMPELFEERDAVLRSRRPWPA